MSDLHKILKEEYEKKVSITPNLLIEMIEKAMGKLSPLKEEEAPSAKGDQGTEDFLKYLPKFEMSEKVGELSTPEDKNEARETFAQYLNAVIAADPTLAGKIEYINAFTTGQVADTASIAEILSNLTFLKILSFVVTQFSPAGSGFLFEAFLAALLQGTQITARDQGGALPIDDYREMVDPETGKGGVPVSLKLLSPGTVIEGSIYNIIDFLRRSPIAIEYGGIKYVVAIKTSDNKLEFYKFDIRPEQFFYWVSPDFFKWDVINKAMQQYENPRQELQEQQEQDPEAQFQEFKEFWASIAPSWGQEITPEEVALPIADFERVRGFSMLPQRKEEIINVATSEAGVAGWEKLSAIVDLPDGLGPEALSQAVQQLQTDPNSWDHIKNILKARRLKAKIYTEDLSQDHPHSLNAVRTHLQSEISQDPSALTKDKGIAEMIGVLNKLAADKDLETWGNILIGPPGQRETNRLKDTQFVIQQRKMREGGGVRMGTIITDPEQIHETLLLYSEKLKDMVWPIYKSLGLLTEAINQYYIEGEMLAGQRASNQARELSQYTDKLETSSEEQDAAE